MSDFKDDLRAQVDSGIDELRKLRDEIRVRLHLGGMDAKDAWAQLEPRLGQVEEQARQATDDVADSLRIAVDELRKAFVDLKGRIEK